jgi:GNAT superfamily N-acetyltransferase
MPYRRGRKSAAQTPAPRSERIKGSKKNPKGSAASKSSAYKIVLSEKTIKALSQKAKDYNKNHKNSVTLNTLKAVYRRGLGAYSSSHRPTITGGVPNTRNAWAMARVNKFLMKKSGKKVKAAYVQDDDLLAKGGNVFDDKELLKRYKKGKSIGFSAEAHLKAKGLIPRADGKKRKSEKYLADGGQVQELMRDGIVEIKMFDTTNEHSKEYGFDAQKPLFIQSIIVSKEHRGKGIGNKVFEYIVDNAKENKYDLIFGHIPQEAEPSIDFIKSMLNKSGFTTIEGNNDFYKIIDIKYEGGGTTLLAPNGKPSNLIPEQYKLVRTPEFKAWFGDWQNDPENTTFDAENPDIRYEDGGSVKSKDFAVTDYGFFNKKFGKFYVKIEGSLSPKETRLSVVLNPKSNGEKDAFLYLEGVDKEGYIELDFISIENSLYRGRGLSSILIYLSLITLPREIKGIKSLYKSSFSDTPRTKDAEKMWDRLSLNPQFIVIKNNHNYIIKLADGSNTTFDGNNSDIRYAEGGFNDEVIICSNCLWSWKASESTPEEKYICHKCGHDNKPTMDKITMDVPLFIRLLEFAREDAKDDMELHTLTENALKMGDKTLTMEDYNEIVFSKITSPKITKSTNSLVEFPTIEQEFADGGVVVGKRHSESDEFGTGEKFLVESTGQIVELEGGEGVLCKESMQSWHYYKFDGKEMTGRQIASYLNHKYGGVEFAKGGEVDEKSVCGCRSMYYHGGELPSATLDSLKGGEAVVTVKTMESKDKFQFQGRYMTPRKILSHINQESGGKKFEDGGIIDLTEHHLKNATNMVKMINFTEKIFYF